MSPRSSAGSPPAAHLRRQSRIRRPVALLAALPLLASGLAACASAGPSGSSSDTLTIAIGADPGESLNPYASNQTPTQETRDMQLYEGLTTVDPKGLTHWGLATAMRPNKDLTEWTITLRSGVTFTDGSPFTATDVVASIKYLRDDKHAAQGLPLISMIDPNRVTAVDPHTVTVGLTHPFGPFKNLWTSYLLPMTKAGSVPAKPVGTGPFKVASFTPGQATTLDRFDGYWGTKPKVRTVKLVEYQNDQAEVNALLSKQADIASSVSPTIARSLKGRQGIGLLDSAGDHAVQIGFDTRVAPFNDPRVIQALQLVVNRKQVVDSAYGGFGRIGNDHIGGTRQCGEPDIPQRAQDLARARQLLAAAGQSKLTFSLATDGLLPGMKELAQVFAENAAQAGVTVKINILPSPDFLSKWGKWPAFLGFTTGDFLSESLNLVDPDNVGNATHWNNAEYRDLADQLFHTTDVGRICTLENAMHKVENENGSMITPAFSDVLVPHRSNVKGLVSDVGGLPLRFLTGVSVGS